MLLEFTYFIYLYGSNKLHFFLFEEKELSFKEYHSPSVGEYLGTLIMSPENTFQQSIDGSIIVHVVFIEPLLIYKGNCSCF